MNEAWSWVVAPLAGAALGVFFFGGLWWTVQRLGRARHPHRWVLGSFLVRTTVTLAGFVAVMGQNPLRLLLAVACFLLIRAALVHRVRRHPLAAAPE